ncbi:MAG: cell division protein FtsA [Lachnospiraceae bacterium]|nr:cell division protein FtsA [Lachnospiraceae bacterium]
MRLEGDERDYVFGLDIGTRNVVGSVGYLEDKEFHVLAQYSEEHESRAMLDGQIHDINRVSGTIAHVKENLENQVGFNLTDVCIAAAGRVLRTVTTRVEMVFPEEKVVTGEDLNTLDLMGVDQAQRDILAKNERYKFYCVGYTVMKYYLNGERFSNLEGHKAERIEEVIIVTFLPEDVVDGLYSAVERCGLTVANLTLEPIAAINVAIPENFRMLNIALVDVGAGTSDICITKDGSIIAYGMIPAAGDELTEVIVQAFLVDFAMAERIKKDSTELEEITYEDIMGISHKIKAQEVWKLTDPVMEKITTDVAAQIKALNGDETVAAAFIVGGGGKVHGFCEALAKKLDVIEERVALRGEEVMKEVFFEQKDIKKDPLLVTPIGICLNYYEQKNSFIMIRFNGDFVKLYDNGHLKVVDAALQAGFSTEELFPQRGRELHFTVDGKQRIVRGTQGESATVRMNGNVVGLNDRLEPNSQITVEASTVGEEAVLRVEQLDEFANSYVTFIVNGQRVKCPKFVEVNGKLEPGSYVIAQGDAVEMRNFYTVGQLAAFMDVEVDPNHEIIVNNLSSDMDTLVYENFTIEWTVTGYGLNDGDYRPEGLDIGEEAGDAAEASNESVGEAAESAEDSAEEAAGDFADAADSAEDTAEDFADTADENGTIEVESTDVEVRDDTSSNMTQSASPSYAGSDSATGDSGLASRIGKIPPGMGTTLMDEEDTVSKYVGVGYNNVVPTANSFTKPTRPLTPMTKEIEIPPQVLNIRVKANGQEITLTGKKEYIFADIFMGIEFDVNAGEGRQVETTRNGEHCVYTTPIFEGDTLEIYWKDE